MTAHYRIKVSNRDLWLAIVHSGYIWVTDPNLASTWEWPDDAGQVEIKLIDLEKHTKYSLLPDILFNHHLS
jgi:hypothetical protein